MISSQIGDIKINQSKKQTKEESQLYNRAKRPQYMPNPPPCNTSHINGDISILSKKQKLYESYIAQPPIFSYNISPTYSKATISQIQKSFPHCNSMFKFTHPLHHYIQFSSLAMCVSFIHLKPVAIRQKKLTCPGVNYRFFPHVREKSLVLALPSQLSSNEEW